MRINFIAHRAAFSNAQQHLRVLAQSSAGWLDLDHRWSGNRVDEATVRKELTGKDQGQLVGANGKSFHPDPLPPLAETAAAFGATPVLWLPEAAVNRNLRLHGSNLIVVMGSARHLKHALLGAEVDSPRHAPPALPSIPQRRKKPRPVVVAKPTQELTSSEPR